MNKYEFLELVGVEKKIHPSTNAIHMVKNNKSVSMQGPKNKIEEEVINDATRIMVARIVSPDSDEPMPAGLTREDLRELCSSLPQLYTKGVSRAGY